MNNKPLFLLASLLFLLSTVANTEAQGTAFTYQGRLTDNGGTRGGIYDLRFTIYDLAGGGSAIAGPLTTGKVAVSNGLFTTALDFGAAAFAGAARWLEIGVRTNGSSGDFTTLIPRQPITPTPYALFAGKAAMLTENASQTFTGPIGFNPSPPGAPPFAVASAGKVTNLNADLFDGLDSTNFLLKSEGCLPNLAELKARDAGFVPCVTVLGYYAPGDGGGGNFYWDASTAEATNSGTVFVPDSNPPSGRWKRLANGPLSVKWFGAKGDGTNDDGQAIRFACDALQSAGGGQLVFPTGLYKVYSTNSDYRQLGNFSGLSGVQIISDSATLAIDPARIFTESYGTAFQFSDCRNIKIDGFSVTGPVMDITQTAVKGVEFTRFLKGCVNVSMPHNKVQGVIAGVIISRAKEGPSSDVSRNFHIGVLEVTQAWYGFNCQNSGDNVTIDTLKTDNVHRSYFVYGCRNHKVRVASKDAYAADCLLASYNGSNLEDVDLYYGRQTDTTNSSDGSPGVWIQWKDSIAGTFRNIKINLNVKYAADGQTGANAVRISKMTNDGMLYDTNDRGHILENLTISGIVEGIPHDGNYGAVAMDGLCTWGPGDAFRNIVLENLHIKDHGLYCTWFMGPFRNHLVCRNVRMPGTLGVGISTNDATKTFEWQVIADNLDCKNLWTNQDGFRPIERRYDGSNYTVQKGYRGKVLSNKGAAGTKIDSLPASEAGLEFKFMRDAAFEYRIVPNGTELIRGGDSGKYLSLNVAGNYAHLKSFGAGTWEILSSYGSLAYEP